MLEVSRADKLGSAKPQTRVDKIAPYIHVLWRNNYADFYAPIIGDQCGQKGLQ
jgi:hypothetical protein